MRQCESVPMTQRGSMFRRYVVYCALLVAAAFMISAAIDLYFPVETERASSTLMRIALLAAAGLVLSALASLVLTRRVLKPLQAIEAGAAQLATGRLEQPIHVRSGDELEALGTRFNEMAERLNETYAGLERKAEERTHDLTEALEQQTATSEILRVISSSRSDLEPVFDKVLESAIRLCDADFGTLGLCEGAEYEYVHQRGAAGARAEWLWRGRFAPDPESGLGRVIAESQPIHVADISAGRVTREPSPQGVLPEDACDARTCLWVPMLKEGRTIGVLSVCRCTVRAFTPKQIELVSTFANQAVIAIENARLFTELEQRNAELTESLEQQTATSEVLKVISRTAFDLNPVLETLVENAVILCGASQGVLFRLEQDIYRLEIAYNTPEEYIVWRRDNPIRSGRDSITGRAVMERHAIQVDDVLSDTEYRGPSPRLLGGQRTILAVPLLREEVPIGVIAIFRDRVQPFTEKQVHLVTTFADQAAIAIENVRLFNEIRSKSRQLEIANRHKLDFLAGMSHELRTPLNAIIGFSEVLQERMFGDINEKQAEYLSDIHGSGMHLLSLINDILDLSKIDAGRMELELSRFDLVAAIENTVTLVRERATRNHIDLEVECDADLGEWTADERKFKQIMLNLLSNAVKFTPAGGQIRVRALRRDGNAEFSVSDTGVGIKPEEQDLVFEEFRQAGRDYLKKSEGTGLGLALTRRFVELHRGRIVLQSEPGKGSTFTFTLPDKIEDSLAPQSPFGETLLASLRHHLTKYVGPIAPLVIARATKRSLHVEDLVSVVAEAIALPADRERFVKEVSSGGRPAPAREAPKPAMHAEPVTAQAPPRKPAAHALRETARLPALEKLLATYIGPMAKILVAKAAKRAHSEEELIGDLAQGIDSERDRSAFRSAAIDVIAASRQA